MLLLALLLGLVLGACAAWLALRGQAGTLRVQLELERARSEEKVALLEQTGRDVAARFDQVAADALRKNHESFLALASGKLGETAKPIAESLEKMRGEVQTLELTRRQDYGMLKASIQTLTETGERWRSEVAGLTTALRSSEVRGAWGQMQLRNAVETAGMLAHCDFLEEVHVAADGR